MSSITLIQDFEKTWLYTRKITTDFLEAIPENKWHYTHHPKYSPLSKQFRHMACVYGVYIDGFKNRGVDFSKKHSHYSGPLEREAIKLDLLNKDKQLFEVLNGFTQEQVEKFKLDFFGVNMTFSEYTHVLIQHECMHIGIWSNVAAFAEFELPKSWRTDWGFK